MFKEIKQMCDEERGFGNCPNLKRSLKYISGLTVLRAYNWLKANETKAKAQNKGYMT